MVEHTLIDINMDLGMPVYSTLSSSLRIETHLPHQQYVSVTFSVHSKLNIGDWDLFQVCSKVSSLNVMDIFAIDIIISEQITEQLEKSNYFINIQ